MELHINGLNERNKNKTVRQIYNAIGPSEQLSSLYIYTYRDRLVVKIHI